MPGFPHMGYVEVRGMTYRFSPGNKPTGGFHGYSIGAGGSVQFSRGLEAIGTAGSPIKGSGVERGANYTSIWVKYMPDANRGFVETMSCRKE